jgi:hypothetical protein
MKQALKFIFLAYITAGLWACEKKTADVLYEGGVAPVLTASSTSAMVLTQGNAANTAITFRWTNPNYQFNTGLSSQDVSYTLQVDTTGANFNSASKQEVSISKELSKSFTVQELNLVFSKMNVAENVPHNIEFRLKASLANNSLPLYSNVIKMVVTPYLDVAVPVPTNGTLWATGDAFASGYANPLGAPYVTTQQFTKTSNTLYELTVAMSGGGAYKLIQINGDWATQYHMLAGGTWNAGSFEKKDADPGFPGPPSSGNYKISINFKTGTYSVVKL